VWVGVGDCQYRYHDHDHSHCRDRYHYIATTAEETAELCAVAYNFGLEAQDVIPVPTLKLEEGYYNKVGWSRNIGSGIATSRHLDVLLRLDWRSTL
jgi:hypothetical protein